jgi:hypothetical protein
VFTEPLPSYTCYIIRAFLYGIILSAVVENALNKLHLIITFHIFFFLWSYSPHSGLGLPPWNSPFHFSLLDLRQSAGLLGQVISSSQGLCLYTNTEKKHTQTPNVHALSGIRPHGLGFRSSEDSACLRPLGYRDRLTFHIVSFSAGNDNRILDETSRRWSRPCLQYLILVYLQLCRCRWKGLGWWRCVGNRE